MGRAAIVEALQQGSGIGPGAPETGPEDPGSRSGTGPGDPGTGEVPGTGPQTGP